MPGHAKPSTDNGPPNDPLIACQERLLPGVSRTFALTIPQLPLPLRVTVTNAYLLCRIADTVEDDVSMSPADKSRLQAVLIEVIDGVAAPKAFVEPCLELLDPRTVAAERALIGHTATVIAVNNGFDDIERNAIRRCLKIMCVGMTEFARRRTVCGLASMAELDRYCYVVAGCVGEMLTELFCNYSAVIAAERERMMPLSSAFGQGLQMTNILKDVWDDRQHAACWLPRNLFLNYGLDLGNLPVERHRPEFLDCLDALIGVARGHLRSALEYTQLLPRDETGIRNFCLWAIGLAVLTLRKIYFNPDYSSGNDVKVSRRALRGVIAASNALVRSNMGLSLAFSISSHGLPRYEAAEAHAIVTGIES